MELRKLKEMGFQIQDVATDVILIGNVDMEDGTIDDIKNQNYDIKNVTTEMHVSMTTYDILLDGTFIKTQLNENQLVKFFEKEYLEYVK